MRLLGLAGGWGYAAMGVFLLAGAGSMAWRFAALTAMNADARGLILRTPWGVRQLDWRDVRSVEIVSSATTPRLRLSLASPHRVFGWRAATEHAITGLNLENGAGTRFVEATARFRAAAE